MARTSPEVSLISRGFRWVACIHPSSVKHKHPTCCQITELQCHTSWFLSQEPFSICVQVVDHWCLVSLGRDRWLPGWATGVWTQPAQTSTSHGAFSFCKTFLDEAVAPVSSTSRFSFRVTKGNPVCLFEKPTDPSVFDTSIMRPRCNTYLWIWMFFLGVSNWEFVVRHASKRRRISCCVAFRVDFFGCPSVFDNSLQKREKKTGKPDSVSVLSGIFSSGTLRLIQCRARVHAGEQLLCWTAPWARHHLPPHAADLQASVKSASCTWTRRKLGRMKRGETLSPRR